ncbi:divalent-cation tolerance protein CutA [Polynucleobacter necessarius]|uniref:divalent-cation tolerance protein CutA n=1 Tax=Polynucleobacter necessarius TaxID=576610 RepID=UPI000E097B05|nr:divalent-cation tolerance protein CutA [Polynucleobacter necessarius]HAT38824.1 divalent-cation tolerance protein CutA [Polynucleobacter sp.]
MPQTSPNNLDAMLIVVTSLPNGEIAQTLARDLMEAHLAACVQLQAGITSIYRWNGKICEEQEVLLSAKTIASNWQAISVFIKDKHPYEVPEILAFSPAQYYWLYGKWLQSEVNAKS